MKPLSASIALMAALGAAGLASAQDGASPAAPAPAAAAYPTRAVAAEFEGMCGKKMKLAERRALAVKRGWTASGELAALREVVEKDYQDKLARHTGGLKAAGEHSFFRRTVAGEALDLVVFRSRAGDAGISGCNIFDQGERREDLVPELEKEIGGKFVVRGVNPGLAIILWGTQEGNNAILTQLIMTPPESESAARLGFSGLRLQRDYAGDPEQ